MRSLLRSTHFLRQPLTTPSSVGGTVSTPLLYRRSLSSTLARHSTAGYGDADQTGDDPSNKPNLQGPRPRIDTEHPGREPVDEGKGTGSGGYAEPGGTGGNGESGRGAERKGNDQGGMGAQKGGESGGGLGRRPVRDMEDPMPDEGEKGDVERHNKEMDQRYGYKEGGGKDEKVGKGFWSGDLGSVEQ